MTGVKLSSIRAAGTAVNSRIDAVAQKANNATQIAGRDLDSYEWSGHRDVPRDEWLAVWDALTTAAGPTSHDIQVPTKAMKASVDSATSRLLTAANGKNEVTADDVAAWEKDFKSGWTYRLAHALEGHDGGLFSSGPRNELEQIEDLYKLAQSMDANQ